MIVQIPFDRVGHLTRIPAGVAGLGTTRLLVDTGIGITLVNTSTADRAGLRPTGSDYVGRRMSGQEVRVPLVQLSLLTLGERTFTDLVVGVLDLGPSEGEQGFDGIVGLDVLGALPLTVDPFARVVRLGSGRPSSGDRIEVPARLHRDGPAVDMRTELRLPDGQVVEVEIDTGSGSTILDSRFMVACSVDGSEAGARTTQGVDETGHEYVRRFVPIRGALELATEPTTRHERPTVQFQDLELDGLIGTDFLDRYVQTYDTRSATITLAAPRCPAG